MSKLIVEMEMPCNIQYLAGLHGTPTCPIKKRMCKDANNPPKWCPIKGELQDEHGDLIDTSTVVGSIKRETDIHDVTLKEYLGFKFPVQTIVPIDEFLENRKTIPIIVAAERKNDGK